MNLTATLRSALGKGLIRTVLLSIPLVLALIYAATQGGSSGRIVTVAFINLVIVLGIQVFTGNTGIESFGHIGFVALGAYITAILTANPEAKAFRIPDAPFGLATVEIEPLTGMFIAVIIVVIIAAIIGLAISRMGGVSATMITLALLIIVHTVLTDWVQFSGGAEGFFGIPVAASLPLVFGCAIGAVLFASVYRESPAGLRSQAVREDELAARAMGVNTVRARFWSWVLSAAICALGGALLALFLGSITPHDFYLKLTFATLAMLFVGGVHSVTGAVTGVVVITIGNEIFRWLGNGTTIGPLVLPQMPGLTDIFLGLVIMGTMLWRGLGLLGNIEIDEFLKAKLRSRRTQVSSTPVSGRMISERAPRVLEAHAVERTFGGLRAVAGVDLTLRTGEVVGLIGPNGSGKSTLLNMLSGVIAPTAGSVTVGGVQAPKRSDRVAAVGVGRTFQNIRLFGSLTVEENIAVAHTTVGNRRRPVQAAEISAEVVRRLGLNDALQRPAGTLPYGEQRKLEIARAMALMPDFILLDEPVAGMNEVESQEIAEVVRMLASDLGVGVLVVDHDLPFILGLCSRIYVMESGECIMTGTPEEVRANSDVIAAYIGAAAESA